MSYKIDFFDAFQCIGSECNNSCCCGWTIPIDLKTYEFYQKQQGDFAEYVKKNISKIDEECFINMTDKWECPFWDDERLCRIYKEYGLKHQGITCQTFPKSLRIFNGEKTFYMFSHGCEEVLRLIFQHEGPIYLIQDTDGESIISEKQLAEFMSIGMDILQENSIPLGTALGTVLYLCKKKETYLSQPSEFFDLPNEKEISDLLKEFATVQYSMAQEKLEYVAWKVIFCIVDTFCNVVSRTDLRSQESILWDESVFELSVQKRKKYLQAAWKKNRNYSETAIKKKRSLYASFFVANLLLCNNFETSGIFIEKICNYIILSELLPCVWKKENDYLSNLSELGRVSDSTLW